MQSPIIQSKTYLTIRYSMNNLQTITINLTEYSKLKSLLSLVLQTIDLNKNAKAILLLDNLNHLAENIVVQSDDDLRLLQHHLSVYDSNINLYALCYEDMSEIEDGCFLVELKQNQNFLPNPNYKSKSSSQYQHLTHLMVLTYSKMIQQITILDDNLTLDMNIFQKFDQKVQRYVEETAQGKQFMTKSQLQRYEQMWYQKPQFEEKQKQDITSLKNQSQKNEEPISDQKSKQPSPKNSDENFLEVQKQKQNINTVNQVINEESKEDQIMEEVKYNIDQDDNEDSDIELVEDDNGREGSEKDQEEAFEIVDQFMNGTLEIIDDLTEAQIKQFINEEFQIPQTSQQVEDLSKTEKLEVKQNCMKCTQLLKSDRETFYVCQECRSIYLCERCEDIYSHNHPFLKVKPDPVLLNLHLLQSKYKEIDQMAESMSESIYDNNEIIKRLFVIKNTGEYDWPADTKLYLIDNPFNITTNTPIKMGGITAPNQSRKISIKIRTPFDMGKYRLVFRLGIEGKFNQLPDQLSQTNNTHIYQFGKPLTIEFDVLEKVQDFSSHHDNLLRQSQMHQSQIINEDYLRLDQEKETYLSQVKQIKNLSKDRKKAHKFLIKLGFLDFNKNDELLKNCKDNVQVVSQILIQEQMKQLKML